MSFIYIISNGDRLGGNLSFHIAYIFYAHYFKLPLKYYNTNPYDNSIFMMALKKFIENYNKTTDLKNKNKLLEYNYKLGWYGIQAQTLFTIKIDYITYFKKHLYETKKYLQEFALQKNYNIPFDPKKTILIHLRLNDVRGDYPGSCRPIWPTGTHETCNNVYRDFIDNNEFYKCNTECEYRQAPIDKKTLFNLIEKAKIKYPDREIIIITSPGENLNLPYKIISNKDESLDLYLLCNSEIIITSRSTFGFMPLLFGIVKEAWVPKWCHFAMFGLTTKFDKNTNINFY